jgi:ABC-2 type transport system ATP-binding protein
MTENTPDPIVEARKFNLTLGDTRIVKDLDFEVWPGEVFAFLGANGSGKTTTIRAMLGIHTPTSGTIHINGRSYGPDQTGVVGYLPEERGLYTRSKVLDTMIYFGELKGMSRIDAKKFSQIYLEQVGLLDKASVKIKKLSGGQQQKVQLGVAIMNNPKLLILDEPTKGLDPVNRKLLIAIVEEQRSRGTAIIYITHLMEEVERLADRVIVIKDGERKAYGTVHEIKQAFGKKTIEEVFVAIYEGDHHETE